MALALVESCIILLSLASKIIFRISRPLEGICIFFNALSGGNGFSRKRVNLDFIFMSIEVRLWPAVQWRAGK